MDSGFRFDEEKFNAAIKGVQQAFAAFAENLTRDVAPALHALFANLLDKVFVIGWQRRDYESDSDYAQRLADDNWLDNPDARWEYQKIVLNTPIRIFKRWIRHDTT